MAYQQNDPRMQMDSMFDVLYRSCRNSADAQKVKEDYLYYKNMGNFGTGLRIEQMSAAQKYMEMVSDLQFQPMQYPSTALTKVPEVTSLPEEHLVNALTGYRAWNVPLFVDELRSVSKASKWIPYRKFAAECESDQCRGVKCLCGIYAFNKLDLVKYEYRGEGLSRKYVYGEVYLWGRVLECKNGYRAQFAYPKAFVNTGAIAKRMSEVFGVPLISGGKE